MPQSSSKRSMEIHRVSLALHHRRKRPLLYDPTILLFNLLLLVQMFSIRSSLDRLRSLILAWLAPRACAS